MLENFMEENSIYCCLSFHSYADGCIIYEYSKWENGYEELGRLIKNRFNKWGIIPTGYVEMISEFKYDTELDALKELIKQNKLNKKRMDAARELWKNF